MSKFGERLKKMREAKGLNQGELACILNVGQTTVGMYENGHREPNIERLNQIATYFNVSLDYLVGRTNDPTKEYKPTTRELLDMLHLSDDEIFERGPHTLDGKILTRDEFKTIITAVRLKRQLELE